jgi:hypothetical protein
MAKQNKTFVEGMSKLRERANRLTSPIKEKALELLKEEDADCKTWPNEWKNILKDAEQAITSMEADSYAEEIKKYELSRN